jgi:hypothetical protein
MTESNWRAQHRAALWERLYGISDELMELVCRWEENDPEMASWDRDGASQTGEPMPPLRRNPKSRRRNHGRT